MRQVTKVQQGQPDQLAHKVIKEIQVMPVMQEQLARRVIRATKVIRAT
jgi:hypothetical protein